MLNRVQHDKKRDVIPNSFRNLEPENHDKSIAFVLVSEEGQNALGFSISGHHSSVRKDENGDARNTKLFSDFDAFIDSRRLTSGSGQGPIRMGVFKKVEGFFANNRFRLVISPRMHLQRVHLDVKSDVLPLFDDLLHLLMKFGAVRSVRIVKSDDPNLCLGVPHDQGILQRDL